MLLMEVSQYRFSCDHQCKGVTSYFLEGLIRSHKNVCLRHYNIQTSKVLQQNPRPQYNILISLRHKGISIHLEIYINSKETKYIQELKHRTKFLPYKTLH